jgi:hypothetical protein
VFFRSHIRPSEGNSAYARGLVLIVTLMAAVVLPRSADCGAWTQPAGGVYARLAANRYFSQREFDADGRRVDFRLDGEFEDRNVALYLEYGLLDRLTLSATGAAKRLTSDNRARTIESDGVADVSVALRGRLLSGRAGVASLQGLVKVPSGYDTDVPLPLGNGETEWEMRALWGRSLWPLLPGYGGVEVGYRWRGGDFADEFRYLVEAGSDLGRRAFVRVKLDGTRGARNGGAVDEGGNPTVRGSYDLGVLDMTAGVRVGAGVALEAGVAPALYGRTTTSGSTFSLAVAYAGLGRS